ncbi:MAG: hypothetical protein ACYTGR_10860 [Planctomycetota bacterium]|jgi:hypothetical protein
MPDLFPDALIPDVDIDWIGLPLVAAAVIGFAIVRLRSPGVPARCVGSARRLRSPAGCGYDLRVQGEQAGSDGEVTCPECGRRYGAKERIEAKSGWRLRRTTLVIGLILTAVLWIPSLPWRRLSPDIAIALGERVLGAKMPVGGRDEVLSRVRKGEIGGWSAALIADAAIAELGADDERGNAVRARRLLVALEEHDALDGGIVPRLEAAIRSSDLQRRQAAACLLYDRRTYVDRALIAVAIEGLADDGLCWWHLADSNRWSGELYLRDHIGEAAEQLVAGLSSRDLQQRVSCASLLLRSDLVSTHDRARLVLIDHLADNTMSNDARVARASLRAEGRAALPDLDLFRDSQDAQQRRYVRWLMERIVQEERMRAEKAAAARAAAIVEGGKATEGQAPAGVVHVALDG